MDDRAVLSLMQQMRSQQQQNKPKIEFKAGKMKKEGKMVKPDTRKGKVVFIVDPEDSLLHCQWRVRESDKVEDDVVVLPGTAKWVRIEKVKTGRVYMLESPGEYQHFYWMQEPKAEKDDDYSNKINELINNNGGEQQHRGLFDLMSRSNQSRQQQQQRSGVDFNQLQQILRGVGGNSQTTLQPPNASQSNNTQQQQQQQPQQQQQQQQQQEEQQKIELSDVLISDQLCSIISKHPDIAKELIEYLPEGTSADVQSVCKHVRSAQFKQAMDMFYSAMISGELAGLMMSMGLPPDSGSIYAGGVQSFLNEVQKKADEKGDGTSSSSSGDKKQGSNDEKKDDNMDTS